MKRYSLNDENAHYTIGAVQAFVDMVDSGAMKQGDAFKSIKIAVERFDQARMAGVAVRDLELVLLNESVA